MIGPIRAHTIGQPIRTTEGERFGNRSVSHKARGIKIRDRRNPVDTAGLSVIRGSAPLRFCHNAHTCEAHDAGNLVHPGQIATPGA